MLGIMAVHPREGGISMSYQDFIRPELGVLIPVLYFIGKILKSSRIPDYKIPAILGVTGVFLATLYVAATSPLRTLPEIAMGLFVSITQGILVAGNSVYFHQLKKQHQNGKEENGKENEISFSDFEKKQ